MEKSKTITTKYGEVTFDPKYNWYEGNLTFGDIIVNVMLDVADGEERPFETLEKIGSDLAAVDSMCRDAAAEEMLDTANDWLEDDDSEDKPDEYTEDMFKELMNLESIMISPRGSYSLGYGDGEMFWGHSIIVDVDEDGQCIEAVIAG